MGIWDLGNGMCWVLGYEHNKMHSVLNFLPTIIAQNAHLIIYPNPGITAFSNFHFSNVASHCVSYNSTFPSFLVNLREEIKK